MTELNLNEVFAESASQTVCKSLTSADPSPQQRKRLKQRRENLEKVRDYARIEKDLYDYGD